jgi:hypothetical protein
MTEEIKPDFTIINGATVIVGDDPQSIFENAKVERFSGMIKLTGTMLGTTYVPRNKRTSYIDFIFSLHDSARQKILKSMTRHNELMAQGRTPCPTPIMKELYRIDVPLIPFLLFKFVVWFCTFTLVNPKREKFAKIYVNPGWYYNGNKTEASMMLMEQDITEIKVIDDVDTFLKNVTG